MQNNVIFILPDSGKKPVGGFKVVYEYANRLMIDGFEVSILYVSAVFWKEKSLKDKLLSVLRFIFRKLTGNFKPKWFELNSHIVQKIVFDFNQIKNIDQNSKLIATSWQTAEFLNNLEIPKKNKFYLIQHYEVWDNDENRLIKTWISDLRKFVIAPWLKEIGDDLNVDTILLPNGFDFNQFYLKKNIESRNSFSIAMLYHVQKWKGFEDGFEAIKKVKEKIKKLELNLFGVYSKPNGLPDWVNYYQLPSKEILNDLYNDTAIFLGPSHTEGWGLTIGEAMICGCAVVCTNNKGYSNMVMDNYNGLLVNVGDIEEMASAIEKLILNKNLKFKLANNGINYIGQFTWEKSYSILKNELLK
jgi:glycosyltransferase involved in cell wall biosynthesis